MQKPDMETARKMAEGLARTFMGSAFVPSAVQDALDVWQSLDLIDNGEKNCRNCGWKSVSNRTCIYSGSKFTDACKDWQPQKK